MFIETNGVNFRPIRPYNQLSIRIIGWNRWRGTIFLALGDQGNLELLRINEFL
jgi:hypothetical protein